MKIKCPSCQGTGIKRKRTKLMVTEMFCPRCSGSGSQDIPQGRFDGDIQPENARGGKQYKWDERNQRWVSI